MKRIFFLFMLLCSAGYSQSIELSFGPTISSYDYGRKSAYEGGANGKEYIAYFYPENYTSFNIQLGVEYLKREHYSIASSVGYFERGGYNQNYEDQNNIPNLVFGGFEGKAVFGYISLNTIFRLKSPNKYFTLFLGVGPKLDLLINQSNNLDLKTEKDLLNKINYGVEFESGITKEFSRFSIGAKYLFSYGFMPTVSPEKSTYDKHIDQIYSHTINITLGYNFKK